MFNVEHHIKHPTRKVHGHEDGLGLNDLITIEADARDPNAGGSSHRYHVWMDVTHTQAAIESGCTGEARGTVAAIDFQHGARMAANAEPGITEAVLLAILIDRVEGFQAGPFACQENAEMLKHLRAASLLTRDRAIARAHRGVLGKNEK